MTNDFSTYDQIQRYLQGTMSEGERLLFEQEMATNSGLAEEVEASRMMREMMVDAELLEQKERFKQFNFESGKFEPPVIKSNKGLGILSLIGVFFLAFFASSLVEEEASRELAFHKESPARAEEPKPALNSPDDPQSPTSPERPEEVEELPEQPNIHEDQLVLLTPDSSQVPTTPNIPNEDSQEPVSSPQENQDQQARVETAEPPVESDVPCEQRALDAVVSIESSCDDEATGTISITKPTGGKEPFSYALDDTFIRVKDGSFSELNGGFYEVFLIDADKCERSLGEVEVQVKSCSSSSVEEQAFSLSRDLNWGLPIDEFESGRLSIFSVTGALITELDLPLPGNTWDGRNNLGQFVTPGNYPYIIELDNGDVVKSAVTVRP